MLAFWGYLDFVELAKIDLNAILQPLQARNVAMLARRGQEWNIVSVCVHNLGVSSLAFLGPLEVIYWFAHSLLNILLIRCNYNCSE